MQALLTFFYLNSCKSDYLIFVFVLKVPKFMFAQWTNNYMVCAVITHIELLLK